MRRLFSALAFLPLLVGLTTAHAVEVELQLVPYDNPALTVDKRVKTVWVNDTVNTATGIKVQVVGMGQTLWPRNIVLDDDRKIIDQQKLIFEIFYKGKYVARRPRAIKDLKPGKHVVWPGNHEFTVGEDGTVTTDSPELIAEGNLVRIKTYPVTIGAFYRDHVGNPTGEKTGLPALTIRDAGHAAKQKLDAPGHRDLLAEVKLVGDHGEVSYPFAPLTLYLPANTSGSGYLIHPLGVTFHLTSDGVKLGAGSGVTFDAIVSAEKNPDFFKGQVLSNDAKFEIAIPKFRFPVSGPAGAQAILGIRSASWSTKDAGSTKFLRAHPRLAPYEFRIANIGPSVEIDGSLSDWPVKSMSVDFADRKIGTQRGMVVELLSRHLTSGKRVRARIRAIDATQARLAQEHLSIIEAELKQAERALELARKRLSQTKETEPAKLQQAKDEVAKAEAELRVAESRVEQQEQQLENVNQLNPIADAPRFGRIQLYEDSKWTELDLSDDGDRVYSFVVPEMPPGVYKLRIGVRSGSSEVAFLTNDQWITIAGARSTGVGLFTQRGRDAFYRGESFWIAAAVDATAGALPTGTPLNVVMKDASGNELPILTHTLNAPLEQRHTFILRLDADTSRKLAPGWYDVVATLGQYRSRTLRLEIVDPDPKTHFANVLIGKYNTLQPDYEKVLATGEGADRLARAIHSAGFNSFKGMSYGLHRIKRSESHLELLVRERPALGAWESFYQPSNRDRFTNACVRYNIRFWENMFTHHDQMMPRGEKFISLCERFTSLETASMRHSPAFQGVCLYDEFTNSLDHDTAQELMAYFRQQQEVNYRRRNEGMTSGRAMKALERFLGRPPQARDYKDLERFRTWPAHEDWEWENFSNRMATAAHEVMPSSRNFTLHRFAGGNGENITAGNGYAPRNFKNLDIAACVVYKDGGYGDWPMFAPMQADVLRTRDDQDVWTQVHVHSGPPLYQKQIMRQVFFGLSQKVEGITFFECQTRPMEPKYIDHADVLRDCTNHLTTPYGDLLLACDKGYKRVAIYYSRAADHLELKKKLKATYQIEGLWVALMRAGYPADILYDEQIVAGKAMEYDVIFVPNFTIDGEAPPEILKSLQRLVDARKILVAERTSKLPIEGVRRLDTDFHEYNNGLGGYWPKYLDRTFDDAIELSEKTTSLVKEFLQRHIPPAAEHDLLMGPDWLRCRQGRYLFVTNFAPTGFRGLSKTNYQAPHVATLRFPKAGEVCYDVLEMKRVELTRGAPAPPANEAAKELPLEPDAPRIDWQSLRADMRHYPGKMFAFLPAAIDRVKLEANGDVVSGAGVNYRVSVVDSSGKTIDAGFPLEIRLTDPTGKLFHHVYRSAAPVYQGASTIPANAQPGAWKLRVRELISGTWAEAMIDVKQGDLPTAELDERRVWVRDGDKIAKTLAAGDEISILVDDRQTKIRPHVDRLIEGLKARNIRAKVLRAGDYKLPTQLLVGGIPHVDGHTDWRGNRIQPAIFYEMPVIVIGRRGEHSAIEALIGRDALAEPLTENFPGQGRALIAWTRRAFSNYYDCISVLANDEEGLRHGIDELLNLAVSKNRLPGVEGSEPPAARDRVHPTVVIPKFDPAAKLTESEQDGRQPSSFRERTSHEDLVMSIDVDQATGRSLVGTWGYGQNLFCIDADGRVLWQTFLPEHNVYLARWYDGGKRVIAATARGFHLFLLDGQTGNVLKTFAATEWPKFHGTEGAVTTNVNLYFNEPLRQILIVGSTGLMAIDYEGRRMWFFDRLPAIQEYCQEAEQTAAASFLRNCQIRGITFNRDGTKIAYSENRVIGSAIGFGDSYYDVWAHRPAILDAQTGKVLVEYQDNRGSSGNCLSSVVWPAGSDLPFSRIDKFVAVLNPDGTIGEYDYIGNALRQSPMGRLDMDPNHTRWIAADGEVKWEVFDEEPWLVPALSRPWSIGDTHFDSAPISADGKRLYRTNPFGLIRAFDVTTGKALWENNVRFGAKLVPVGDRLIAATNHGLVTKFDAQGKPLWRVWLRELFEKPARDYPRYVHEAERRRKDSSQEFYAVAEDGPDDFAGVLRMGIEQVADGGFETVRPAARRTEPQGKNKQADRGPREGWITLSGELQFVPDAHRGARALRLAPGQLVEQRVERKVIRSATYLLEFWYKTDAADTNLAAACKLGGNKPALTASILSGIPGQWTFGRLAVKSMSDSESLSVAFEAEGGPVTLDAVSLRAIRFPSANLLADPQLHEVEPTFVDDIRVQYDKLPTGLREKLMNQNHVAVYRQGGTSSASIYLQEQAFLHNGRLDDMGPRWTGMADAVGFSAVLSEPAWISHVVLYLNNATPENTYRFITVLANDMSRKPPVPKTVGVVRGNQRRFVVVHLPEPIFTDSIKILPGKHQALRDCLTEVELYGPLGGPHVSASGFPDDPDGVPMFMSAPSHVPAKLPADLVDAYRSVFAQHHNAAFHSDGTIFHDQYNVGDASGLIRDGEGRVGNRGGLKPLIRNEQGQFRWGPTWLLQTVAMTSTPAHYSGRMLVGAADGKLHAVADGGSYLWGFKTGGRVYSSPVPDGHDVYFGSDDGRLYKVDIDSGILLWEFATGDKIRSSPALVNNRVYFASYDGHLYCLNAETGSPVWKSALAKYTRASPAVHAGRVYIGDEDGKAHCFNAANGTSLWSHDIGGYVSRCALVAPEGVVFLSDQGTAALFDPGGKLRWKRALDARLTGQPVLTQTQLFVPTDKQLFVLVRSSGRVDGRFKPPEASENFVDVTAYRDRLYWVQRRVNVVEFGNRKFAEFRSQVGVWQAEVKKP